MSYGSVNVTVRCRIQLDERMFLSMRQTATVVKTTDADDSAASNVTTGAM